jgi:hypothetical protein
MYGKDNKKGKKKVSDYLIKYIIIVNDSKILFI